MKGSRTSKAPHSIDGWRKALTSIQRQLIDEAWREFQTSGLWPQVRSMCSRHGTKAVDKALAGLRDSVGWEESGSERWKRFRLTLLGVILTSDGPAMQALMVRFFEFQRDLFYSRPEESYTQHTEIQATLNLTDDETDLLGQLLAVGSLGGSSQGNNGWGVSALDEAPEYPKTGGLRKEFERWLLKRYEKSNRNTTPSLGEYLNSTTMPFYGGPLITSSVSESHPPEIDASLKRLRQKYPDPSKVGFLIMRFGREKRMQDVVNVVKRIANKHGLSVVRADDFHFHTDLWGNIRTLLEGCAFGIALYERFNSDQPNANVGIEVGYLMAKNKPVLFLKEDTLATLPADLAGKLYVPFDGENPAKSIPDVFTKWLIEYGIIVKD